MKQPMLNPTNSESRILDSVEFFLPVKLQVSRRLAGMNRSLREISRLKMIQGSHFSADKKAAGKIFEFVGNSAVMTAIRKR